MKRPSSSSDSLGGDVGGACILSICPSSSAAHEEKSMYGRGFQSLLDGLEEDECGEEDLCSGGVAGGGGGEKKRRLSTEQVRALERSFEVENKLEPERKLRLAQDLGLQPRQVAVWFQNRRARWKTKQLERDFCALRANYDTLKLECDSLHRDKESLLAEIKELKTKLSSSPEEESFCSDKETASDKNPTPTRADKDPRLPPTLIYKDGSSDSSDSSAVVNEESSPCQGFSSSTITPLHKHQHQEMQHNKLNSASGSGSTSSEFYYHHQLMKMEEFEEPCSSFFNDEQAPTLNWCLL